MKINKLSELLERRIKICNEISEIEIMRRETLKMLSG